MLWVGLTGGIGAGKSAVSDRLVRAGIALVDADRVAREVVEPGTPGLAAIVREFGANMLAPDGALDREALARSVFADEVARRRLNAIVHPRIAERTVELAAEAEREGARVLVHDVPLLVEGGLATGYHLVVVVESPLPVRLHRLARLRGMSERDARARIAAQAGDDERRAVADVLLMNDGSLSRLHEAVDRLVADRIEPYAENLLAGRSAPRGPVRLVPPDPLWEQQGTRLAARLRAVCGSHAAAVEHVGGTAVPGLAADDVIDLQVECPSRQDADAIEPALRAAGFPRSAEDAGSDQPPFEADPDPEHFSARLHRSADPGRPADVRVVPAGSARARAGVALRDLLRSDPGARRVFESEKQRLAARHPENAAAYTRGKAAVTRDLLRGSARPPDSEV